MGGASSTASGVPDQLRGPRCQHGASLSPEARRRRVDDTESALVGLRIGCLLLRVGTRQESEDAYKTFLRCTLAAGLAAAVEGSRAHRVNVKCQLVVIHAAAGAAGSRTGSRAAGNLLIQYGARVERPARAARSTRARARSARGSLGSGYRVAPYRVECPTTIEPHPLFSLQGREPCPICLDDLALAPAVALPCSGKHAFHVKCLKEVVMRSPNPTCPNCRAAFRTHPPLRDGQRRAARLAPRVALETGRADLGARIATRRQSGVGRRTPRGGVPRGAARVAAPRPPRPRRVAPAAGPRGRGPLRRPRRRRGVRGGRPAAASVCAGSFLVCPLWLFPPSAYLSMRPRPCLTLTLVSSRAPRTQ